MGETEFEFEFLRQRLLSAYREYQQLQETYRKETGVRWIPPVWDGDYYCPVHGKQDGPD